MLKQPGRIYVFILFLMAGMMGAFGQEPGSGPDYQQTMLNNPGLTGAEGDGYIRLSYMNHYPGNSFNLHSGHFSFDGYFPALHGGAGFFVSNDYLGGIVNNFRSGFSYAYFFQAGSKLFISAGLSASLYHRGFSFGGAVLPDQIDPLGNISLPPGETLSDRAKNVLDLGSGFLFMTERLLWGISVSHLAEPDLGDTEFAENKLKRKLLLHFAGDFNLGSEKNLKIRPLTFVETSDNHLSAGAGAVLESNHLSVSAIIITGDQRNTDLHSGFSVSAGNISIFYNYRFNIASGNNLLPFSLLHRTGIALSLYRVDKRRTVHTINFPDL